MSRRGIGIAVAAAALIAATSAHAITVEDQAKRIVHREIDKCFKPPAGVEPPYPPVELLMHFNPFGALKGAPQIVSKLTDKKTSAVALRIVSAASRCVTLKVLASLGRDYHRWQSVRLTVRVRPK